jgi:alkylation response protein AidB-like acyl-CoA dehydrogenase
VSVRRRAALRVAATHAATESAAVVAAVYHAAGGSAIYTSSPLERRFRDAHALRAHMIVGPSTWELAGRVLLGADVDLTML